jgi:hypothetical protein
LLTTSSMTSVAFSIAVPIVKFLNKWLGWSRETSRLNRDGPRPNSRCSCPHILKVKELPRHRPPGGRGRVESRVISRHCRPQGMGLWGNRLRGNHGDEPANLTHVVPGT